MATASKSVNVIQAMNLTNEQMGKVREFRNFPLFIGGFEFRSRDGATLAYQAENLAEAGCVDEAMKWMQFAVTIDREDNELVRKHFQRRSLENIIARMEKRSQAA